MKSKWVNLAIHGLFIVYFTIGLTLTDNTLSALKYGFFLLSSLVVLPLMLGTSSRVDDK